MRFHRSMVLPLALGVLVLATAPVLGQNQFTYHTMSAPQFTPEFPGMPYAFIPPGARMSSLIPQGPFLAEAHPRNRALLMGAYLDGCNDHASATVDMTLTSTDILGNNAVFVGGTSIPPMSGCVSQYVDISAAGYVADDATRHLIARVVTGAGDVTTSFAGVRLGWLQSGFGFTPTPHFNDVPVDHPFFKFIQAMRDFNITGGCQMSPPLYCPNDPVTRQQMAAFIIRAKMTE